VLGAKVRDIPLNSQAITVFIVDDDAVVRNTLESGLVDMGHSVRVFSSAADAIAQWVDHTPDVAIVDINLPDMPGPELALQLHKLKYRPIIALSRHHDSDNVRAAIDAGVASYMVKPVTAVQLVPPMEAAIARCAELRDTVHGSLGQEATATSGSVTEQHLEALLDQFGFGIIIINERKKIVRRNSAAQKMLDAGELILFDGDRIVASGPEDAPALEEFIQQLLAADDGDPYANVLTLGRSTPGHHLQVWGAPLRRIVDQKPVDESPWAVLLVADPDEEIPLPAHILKSMYGLTATEARLAEALVNGLSVEQFAKKSKTSYNTARSHLKSIFVKTRTNRQVDLVRLLSKLLSSLKT